MGLTSILASEGLLKRASPRAKLHLIDKNVNLMDPLYTEDGFPVTVTTREGNTVLYTPIRVRKEEIGEIGQDVFLLSQLKTLEAQISALSLTSSFQGHGQDPPLGLKGEGVGCIVVFRGKLSYRFFKQGGYRANFAPVSKEEALGLLSGKYQLKYVKGTSSYKILPK